VDHGPAGVRQGYATQEGAEKTAKIRLQKSLDTYQIINPETNKVYTLQEWTDLGWRNRRKKISKITGVTHYKPYEELTEAQKERKKFMKKKRYHMHPEVREKAIRYAQDYYWKKGGSKGRYIKEEDVFGKGILREEKNRLLKYMEVAADTNPNFKQVYVKDGKTYFKPVEDSKFIGVQDVKANTIYTHARYDGKIGTSIEKHPDFKAMYNDKPGKLGFIQMQKKFLTEAPDKVLGSYFQKHGKVPSYAEIYNFMKRPGQTNNPLELHHRSLIADYPTKNIQMTLFDKNNAATRISKAYKNPAHPNYQKLAVADEQLKKLGVRLKVGNKMVGAAELGPAQSLAVAKRETVRLFKEGVKKDPELVTKMLKAAGYNIDKCLSSGGRVGYQGAGPVGGVNICIRNVINKEMELAKSGRKGAKEAVEKFTKFGKLASKAGWVVGWADIPIELALALPHLLSGNVQDAKRATTAGLFGYGGKKIDEIDREQNPEAYKYFKHKKDINDWMDAFNQKQDAQSKWDEISDEYMKKYKKEGDPSGVMDRIVDQYDDAVAKQESIGTNYQGYLTEEGEQNFKAERRGKEEGKKYLRETVGKEWKEGWDIDITMPDALPGGKFNVAPFKEDKITSLEQQIKQKGESFYGGFMKPGVMADAESLGVPELYDDWYDAFYGRDPREAYSSLPLDWTNQLADLEKKELYQGLADKLQRPGGELLKQRLIEQGFDMDEFRKYGLQITAPISRAGGGLANLTRTVAPDSGPVSRGLRSLYIDDMD
jgi:hypothetical protein